MIKINGVLQNLESFPDGTLLMKVNPDIMNAESVTLDWRYESDRELVALIFLAKHLRSKGVKNLKLFMPYVPNARQDRVKNPEDVFTLKYFADVVNDIGFESVTVLDVHSAKSEELIKNITVLSPKNFVLHVLDKIKNIEGETPLMFYPDEGAGKRYSGMIELPYAYGVKRRDWATGKILGLDVAGDVEKIKDSNILIVDDICSKGGTFYYSAKKLKELGVKNVYLYISHCENSILDGELIKSGLVEKIFTTDSIISVTHPLIEILNI